MKTPELPQLPKEAAMSLKKKVFLFGPFGFLHEGFKSKKKKTSEEKTAAYSVGYHDALRSLKIAEDDTEKAPVFTDFEEFKKKLEPGDIIMTKDPGLAINPYTMLIRAFTGSPWGHSALYVGDGKVQHISRVRKSTGETVPGTDVMMREHSVDTLSKKPYDFIALRPTLSKKERLEAIERTKALGKPKFSYHDFLQLGYFPWGKTDVNELAAQNKRKELREKLDKMTCAGAVALAYPQINFRKGKSALFTRPSDFLNSDLTKSVARFVAPKESEKKASPSTEALDRLDYFVGKHDAPQAASVLPEGGLTLKQLGIGAGVLGGGALIGYARHKYLQRQQAKQDSTLDKVNPYTRNLTPTSGVVGFPGNGATPDPLPEDKPQTRGDWGGAIWR